MNEVIKFLTENPVQHFATVGVDGKPKVRPFQFMLAEGGKLYFCTSNQKAVYAELQKQPYVEICTTTPSFAWMRLSGKAVFASDLDIKAKILEHSPLVKKIYQKADNPVFEIFYLDEVRAVIADFSGNPPKEYSL